jgi:hypothetical protein
LQAQFFLTGLDFLGDAGEVFEGVTAAEGDFVQLQAQFLDGLKGALGGREKGFAAFGVAAGEIEEDLACLFDGHGVLLFLEESLGAVFGQETQPGA